MRKDLDAHSIYLNDKYGAWSCGFGACMEEAQFIVREDKGRERKEKGACRRHAVKWALSCDGCSQLIRETPET